MLHRTSLGGNAVFSVNFIVAVRDVYVLGKESTNLLSKLAFAQHPNGEKWE